jgi:hypothetical protein
MRLFWYAILVPAALLGQEAGNELAVPVVSSTTASDAPEAGMNVNARYIVEDVKVTGIDSARLSKRLVQEIQRLVGEKFNQQAFDQLARRVRLELHAQAVSQKVTRGDKPEHVKVVLEVSPCCSSEPDVSLSKFLYHARQGWSGKAVGNFKVAPNTGLLLGLASDGDDLLERYAGLLAGFESRKVGSERVRLRFVFESYHQQWNGATLAALPLTETGGPSGLYRSRQAFEPTLSVAVTRSLTVSAGTDFQLIETMYPVSRYQSSNAVTGGLRYRRRFEDTQGHTHTLEAGYEVRSATRAVASDYAYTGQRWHLAYLLQGSKQAVVVDFTAGRLTGNAPLYDRYLLGNSTTLRGWSKFDVAPEGGNRMVHNSLEYRRTVGRHRDDTATVGVFYDTGAVWDAGQEADTRHSVGVAARWGSNPLSSGLYLALAFPVKKGHIDPIFMAGTRF